MFILKTVSDRAISVKFGPKSIKYCFSKNSESQTFPNFICHLEFWQKWKMSFISKRDGVILGNFWGPSIHAKDYSSGTSEKARLF